MKIFVFNRKKKIWSAEGAVAIVAEIQAHAETLYRQEFEFEFDVVELEITSGLMLVAEGYDSTEMIVRHLKSCCECPPDTRRSKINPNICPVCKKPYTQTERNL